MGAGPVAADGAAAVSISPHQVEVFALSESTSLADELVAYLRPRVRSDMPLWWRVLYGSVAWLVAILIGGIVLDVSDVPMVARSLAAGFVSITIVMLLTGTRRPLAESAVYLDDHDTSRQNRRATIVVVAALSGLIGLILGIVLG